MYRQSGITRFFRNLRNSLRSSTKKKLVGEDQIGNKYYEKLADEQYQRRAQRFVESVAGKYAIDKALKLEIPVEWNAWLRYQRNNPPTNEEIQRNYMKMMRTRQRASDLEDKEIQEKLSSSATGEITSDLDSSKLAIKQAFPDFEEFEVGSGVPVKDDYKDKRKPIDRTISS